MEEEKYHELAYYTLAHPDPEFIHQYIVDAYAAQTANAQTKPIKLAFALAGLYLHIEKKYSGKEVQLAHMKMAKNRKNWPVFEMPENRGEIRVSDVVQTKPGRDRDMMIEKWIISVWNAYQNCHAEVEKMVS